MNIPLIQIVRIKLECFAVYFCRICVLIFFFLCSAVRWGAVRCSAVQRGAVLCCAVKNERMNVRKVCEKSNLRGGRGGSHKLNHRRTTLGGGRNRAAWWCGIVFLVWCFLGGIVFLVLLRIALSFSA